MRQRAAGGGLTPHNWDTRQYMSDTSALRMRRHRGKGTKHHRDGQCDVTVTLQNRAEQIQSRAEQTHTAQPGIPHGKNGHAPTAADLNGQTSQRFEEFWLKWPRQCGRDSALHAWVSVVTRANEAAVFSCLERFLASGDAARGAIPNAGPSTAKPGWLLDCARDNWQCSWPPPREPLKP